MSIKQQTRPFQRPEPLRLELGETVRIVVEQSDNAEYIALHSTTPKRRCTGATCKLCAADIGKRESWVLNVYVNNALRNLWMSKAEFASLGAALVGDSGQCAVGVMCEAQTDSKTGSPKLGKDGRPYTTLRFSYVAALCDDDGEVIDDGR
jgi:hypothetical protein